VKYNRWYSAALGLFVVTGLFAEDTKSAATWPDATEQQIREEVFGLRLRVARELKGDAGGEKFLRREFESRPSTEAKAYMAWISFYSAGWGMPSLADPRRGKELAEAAIAEGSTVAMDVYGRALLQGLVPGAKPAEAIPWLEKAAAAGVPRSLGRLGCLKVQGWNTPKDVAGGIELAIRAAELGMPDNLNELGLSAEKGANGDKTKLQSAFRLYALAARHDNGEAWRRLLELGKTHPAALLLTRIERVRMANNAVWMMPVKGKEYVKELASMASDDPEAQVELGVSHLDGYYAKRDYPRARELFQNAAGKGNEDARFYLAKMRLLGFATPREPAALEDIRLLAEAGNVRAASYYAFIHYWGSSDVPGLKKDEAVAFRFVRQAAEKGDVWALANLGFCYLHGIGTAKNNALAAKVYWQAFLRGYKDGLEKTISLLKFIE